ncbi:hypothetical protein LTS18_006677 [Coniosporium uncinatum]|uniref:Uncharacterized protein n=1 Tax=Coniosporium uncinatum TaxID=93489 RepID=A0ACC3D3R7_9PEZI|nr:hypothetical protein LTS18_006677 [Coniosporium uncinatum]
MSSSYRHSTQDLVDGTFSLHINDSTSTRDNDPTNASETDNNNNATQASEKDDDNDDSDKTEDEFAPHGEDALQGEQENENEDTKSDASTPSSRFITRPHNWLDPIPEPPFFHTRSEPCPSDPFLDTLTLLAWPPLMPLGPNQRFRVVVKNDATTDGEMERLMRVQLGDIWYAPCATPMRRLSPNEIAEMEEDFEGERTWVLQKVAFSRLKLCVLKSFSDASLHSMLWEYAKGDYGEGSEEMDVSRRYVRVRDAFRAVAGRQEGFEKGMAWVREAEELVRGSEILKDVLGEMAVLLGLFDDEDEGETREAWVAQLVEDEEVLDMWVLCQPE